MGAPSLTSGAIALRPTRDHTAMVLQQLGVQIQMRLNSIPDNKPEKLITSFYVGDHNQLVLVIAHKLRGIT